MRSTRAHPICLCSFSLWLRQKTGNRELTPSKRAKGGIPPGKYKIRVKSSQCLPGPESWPMSQSLLQRKTATSTCEDEGKGLPEVVLPGSTSEPGTQVTSPSPRGKLLDGVTTGGPRPSRTICRSYFLAGPETHLPGQGMSGDRSRPTSGPEYRRSLKKCLNSKVVWAGSGLRFAVREGPLQAFGTWGAGSPPDLL